MLNVTPVSAGTAGLNYLLRQTGCAAEHEDPERTPEREAAHAGAEYLIDGHEAGEAAGRWLGTGLAHLGLTEAAVADADTVRQVFGRLEHPETGQRLGRKTYDYKAPSERLEAALAAEPNASPERVAELTWQVTNSQQRAIGYFDLTFSPAKSVSLYYAGLLAEGRPEDAAKVWAAHREGVAAAFGHLEGEAGYSRAGYHGRTSSGRSVGDYVEARRWVAARFDHTTNREHEPQLHSHVAVLNRVRCEGDRKWRTLDSRALHHAKRGADAVYELTMEQAVMRDLPVRFAIREDGKAREIGGITVEQRAAVSTRRAQVVARVAAQVREYKDKHGHAPPPYELVLMHQQAALHSRAKKDGPQTPEQMQAQWAVHDTMLRTAVASAEAAARNAPAAPAVDHERLVRAAIHEVQQARASWTRSDLMLAIKQQLPGRVAAQDGPTVERFIGGLADEALKPGSRYGLVLLTAPDVVTPPQELLRDSDGRSRFRPHRDERYCTEGQLSAEERLVATARAGGAPVLTREQLVVVEAELVQRGLGADQRDAVLGILGSGRRGDVLIGPAGAGKSYTTGALKNAWECHHGPVLGLATSQNAANVLREEGLDALNVAAFLSSYEPNEHTGLPYEQLPAGALLVIDETGMSATEQLDRARKVAEAAGAKMLWTGDHAQLDSVGAGGALRLLAADVPVFELTEVRRFDHEWEREASLRLRAGDRSALAEYDHRGRVFEGTVEEMRDAAYEGYLADSLSGKRSLLLVSSNDQAAELAGRVRSELVGLSRVRPDGALLRDGNLAGIGDLIQTRRNEWGLVSDTGRAVANRDVWRVTERTGGGLRVRLDRDPSVSVTLPREYVEQDVTLAYASTSHAAQGRTVDTGHAVVDVSMTRGELYPNLTRGREWNGAYVITNAEADDERGNEPLCSDQVAVLSEVLDRDTAQHAAVQVMREEIADAGSLATMGTIWGKVVSEQARQRYAEVLAEQLGRERIAQLHAEQGAGRLLRAVRNAELAGHDPATAVRAAVDRGGLADAESLSDVLRWRLNNTVADGRGQAASWEARTPVVDTELGRYTQELAAAMDRRQTVLGEQVAAAPPEWARQHLGAIPDEPAQRAEWVQRAGAIAGWRELTNVQGPSVLGAAPSREMPDQRAAWHAAYTALGADEAGRDYAAASDDELAAMVARHDRERDWAPAYVADQLGEAQRHAVTYQRKAVL
ncbi:MAG: MobF family relaxase, partial [Pseudonocardiaceae bacterium]